MSTLHRWTSTSAQNWTVNSRQQNRIRTKTLFAEKIGYPEKKVMLPMSIKMALRDLLSLPNRMGSIGVHCKKKTFTSTKACIKKKQDTFDRMPVRVNAYHAGWCPRWRTRVCRYRETISKTTLRSHGSAFMTSRTTRTRRISVTCWSLPTFCSHRTAYGTTTRYQTSNHTESIISLIIR